MIINIKLHPSPESDHLKENFAVYQMATVSFYELSALRDALVRLVYFPNYPNRSNPNLRYSGTQTIPYSPSNLHRASPLDVLVRMFTSETQVVKKVRGK